MLTHSQIKFYKKWVKRYFFIIIGAFLVLIGLETFLIPNHIIDGGMIGLSIIFSQVTPIPLAIYLILLNLPFLIVGYNQIGKTFAITTLASITILSLFTSFVHQFQPVTGDLFLATIFGGIILGIGVGLIIRNGGSLDGTEIIAIIINKRIGFSVGEIVMFFNLFIMSLAGIIFTWESAMYSLVTYFIAFKTIDIVITGLDESRSVTIISDKNDEIAEIIMARLGRGVTHVYGKGGYTKEDKELLYVVVTRLEVAKLKSIVEDIDPTAFVTIEHVNDVMGGRFQKKSIH
ncbi:YitT family protein [Tepidibacillus marianensis]|uniref:YitT family protein n=1 Tax=Tepidibacillus marianensis TaxID=3131995 RepID=UPI0030D0CB80